MHSVSRGQVFLWVVVLVGVVASGVLASARLSSLPDLGVFLGNDLTVRTVRVDRGPDTDAAKFLRGDRLVAVHRQGVDDLRDLRAVLSHFPSQTATEAARDEGGTSNELASETYLIDYQIVRPLHRFTLTLQGEEIDPTSLPRGVEPDDRLVELNGRMLHGKVRAEGIRSIVASQPDAVLSLERPNAVFLGQVKVQEPSLPFGVVLIFVLAMLVIVVLWRFHNEWLDRFTPLAVAAETACFAWIFLLAFQYQWIIADQVLAAFVIGGLVLMRPLAIFARDQSTDGILSGGKAALALGIVAMLSIIGLMYGGYFAHAELALHAAAIVAGLFIVYEVVAAGFDQGSGATLGERSGYLAGIVVFGLFAALVASLVEPVAFEEDRWRWFAVLIPALVWFGDVLFCVKGLNQGGINDVVSSTARRKMILDYFRVLEAESPGIHLELVVMMHDHAWVIAVHSKEIEVTAASQALQDAVSILVHEKARIPLPDGVDRQNHPMAGIAQTMHMAMALPLTAPTQAIQIPGLAIVLVGYHEPRAGETPSYASSETLDFAQANVTSQVWASAILETLSELDLIARDGKGADGAVDGPPEPPPAQLELEARLAELQGYLEEAETSAGLLQRDRDEATGRLRALRKHQVAGQPTLEACQQLLEPELVDSLRYLMETPEPVAIAGAHGAGRGFVGWCAHLLDDDFKDGFAIIDAGSLPVASRSPALLGSAQSPGMIASCQGGALLVRSAELLTDEVLLRVCEQAGSDKVRLLLCFTADDAERRSVFEGRAPALMSTLGHRELVIPGFRRRGGIMRNVLYHFLEQAAHRRGKHIDGFSSSAMQALESYDYPGELAEAASIIDVAVVRAGHDVIDLENLNF